MQQEIKFRKLVVPAALLYFAMQSLSVASGLDEFARLSNIKDALVEGDCQRFGGTQNIRELDNPLVTLSEKGRKLRGYNNVVDYNGRVYVVYSIQSGGWFAKNVMGQRRMSICKF